MLQRQFQRAGIGFFQCGSDARFAFFGVFGRGFSAEQEGAEHWGDGQSHDCRRYKCHEEGHAEGYEHASFHSGKEKEREEGGGYYQSGVEYGHSHFCRSLVYHFLGRYALGGGERAVFTQAFVDVLHVDNGVVDKAAYGYRYAAEAHGVNSVPHSVQYQHRHDYRQRQSHYGYYRGAYVHQEEEQHDYHKERAFEQRALQVRYGV